MAASYHCTPLSHSSQVFVNKHQLSTQAEIKSLANIIKLLADNQEPRFFSIPYCPKQVERYQMVRSFNSTKQIPAAALLSKFPRNLTEANIWRFTAAIVDTFPPVRSMMTEHYAAPKESAARVGTLQHLCSRSVAARVISGRHLPVAVLYADTGLLATGVTTTT